MGNTVTIKLVKSKNGTSARQRRVLVGLNLRKLNSTSTLVDTPSMRGMINKVSHLVQIVD